MDSLALLQLFDVLSVSVICISMYIVLIDVLIYSAAQLQECLISLLTYLLSLRL